MSSKVSICIPAYRQIEFLKKCVESILIQSYTNYEVIITDDSPDDSVKDLLKEYDFKGKLVYKKNLLPLGSPKNWNEGLSLAKGDYIKILHHDDWFCDKESLKKFVKLLDENPDSDFGFSSCFWIFQNTGDIKKQIPTEIQINKLKKDPSTIFPENFISTPSTIIFRNAQKEYFDENIKWLVDTEYYCRCLFKNKNVAFCSELLVNVLVEAKHQVTSEVRGSREIEIREWVYLYSKIRKNTSFNYENYLHLKKVFDNFNIKSRSDLRSCNVQYINLDVKVILLINKIKNTYKKYVRNKGLIHVLKKDMIPENSKRESLFRFLIIPFEKVREYFKDRYLKKHILLSEKFSKAHTVDVINPIIRGVEINHQKYCYGLRIIIECEKLGLTDSASGRWQINWMDSDNNFLFATYIPFKLNNRRDFYISPLINNVPYFVKKGLLYLTSHDEIGINIYSFSVNGYWIDNFLLKKLLVFKSSGKEFNYKIEHKSGAKNILFIIPWMSVGGGDMVNLMLSENLKKENYNIHFITTENSKNEWLERFRKITKNIVIFRELIKTQNHYDYLNALLKYIEQGEIDTIVVSNSELGYSSLPLIKREFPNIKCFDILHGQGGAKEGGGFPEYSKPYDAFLDKRITINNYLKNYMIEKYGIFKDRIEVIHNCIDIDNFQKKESIKKNNFIVSFIGRLSYEKHPEKIIEIATLLSYKFKEKKIIFEIVGDGPMFNELEKQIHEQKLDDLVILKGHKENVKGVLESTDVLVLCSEMEGLPIILLEAMAMSVPCIATNVGGIPELIDDGKNGYLVDYNSTMGNVVAKKIERLYTDDVLRTKIAAEARKKIEKEFSSKKMINNYLSVFEKAKIPFVEKIPGKTK